MGQLAPLCSPVIINGASITQMLKVMELIKNTCYTQQEMLDSLQLFYCYISHCRGMQCNMVRYHANVQAPLICYQLEVAM